MNEKTITSAQYYNNKAGEQQGIIAAIDGQDNINVPLDSANSDYAEIMRQVAAGTLTIADAD